MWLGTGSFVGQVVSWASTIFVIRLLTPSDYGLMAMTASVTAVLLMLGEFGVGAALIQSKDLKEREIRQIFAWVLMTGWGGAAVCYLSAPWIAQFYREPDLILMIRVLAATMILASFYLVPRLLFIREMNFKVTSQIDILAHLGATGVTLVLAVKGMHVWSLVIGQISLYLIKAVAFNAFRVRYAAWLMPLLDFRGLWNLLRFGVTVTCEKLLYAIYNESDNIVVGRFLGDSVLGSYAVSKTLAVIPEKIIPVITQVSFASYSRIQDDLERVRRNVLRATRVIALAGFPLTFGMAAVAPTGIPFALGEKWASAVVPFQLLCLVLPLRLVRSVLPPPVAALGHPGVNLVNMGITSVVMASAFIIGVSNGIVGVCIAWLIAYPLVFAVTTWRSLRVLGLQPYAYLVEIRFPFIGSAVMLSSLWLLSKVALPVGPVVFLMFQVLVGICLYVSFMFMFRNEQLTELRNLLRS